MVWDVEEPTHCSERVGDDVPGVMAYELRGAVWQSPPQSVVKRI